MTAAETAQLAIVIAPIAQQIITEGSRVIIELKQDLTQEQMLQALENSRSATWPQLDFGKGE